VLVDVGLWLAKAIGGEQIKRLLNRRGLQAEMRSLRKALRESQERREELEGVYDLIERLHAERDAAQAEALRLRVENVRLRERLEKRSR
jgi:predicted nuclease with TOPRIM domain